MASLLPNGKQQFIDIIGRPLVGGQVFFYAPGTETKKDTYQDQAQTTPNTNPVILDARGQATIWGSGSYRQVVQDRFGITVWDAVIDDATAGIAQLSTNLAGASGSSLIGFEQAGTGAVAMTVQDALRQTFTVKQFGAKGDGITDDTAAILAAMQAVKALKGKLVFPSGKYIASDFLMTFADQEALTIEADGSVELYSNKTSPRVTGGSLNSALPGLGDAYDSDYFIRTQPSVVGTTTLSANAERGNVWLSVASTAPFSVGSLIKISSTRLIQTEARGGNVEGQMAVVEEVDTTNSRIRLRDPLEYTAPANTVTNGTVASVVASDQLTLSGINLPDAQARVKCVFPSRGNAYSYISRWAPSSNTAYFRGLYAIAPPSDVAAGDPVQLQWSTTITVYTRYSFNVLGSFIFNRAAQANVAASTIGYRGLDIQYAHSCTIRDLHVYNFSETAIRLWNCYRPISENTYMYGCNRAYDGANGTGYGYSIWGCYAPMISNISGSCCRRLLDFAGVDTITWFGSCRDVQFTGGGTAFTGEAFWPNGSIQQSAVGSHGGSYYSKYINVSAKDCRQFIVIRGYREQIIDPEFSGYCTMCIYQQEGGTGLKVIGGSYEDGISDPEWGSEYQTSSMRANTAHMFAYVTLTSDFPNISISLKDVRATSLSQYFVGLDTSGTVETIVGGVFTVDMANCMVNASAVGSTNTSFNAIGLYPLLAPVRLKYTDGGGNRVIGDGTFSVTQSKLQFAVAWNQTPGDVIQLSDDLYIGCVSDQAALKIPVSANAKTCRLTIWDRELDRAYRGENMLLGTGRNVDYAAGQATNKTGISIQNAILTGTTGPSGSLNIAFRPASAPQTLYIENRLGGEMRPIFTLKMIE